MALFGRKKKDDEAPPVAADKGAQPGVDEGRPPMPRRTLDEQRAFLLEQVSPLRPFGMQVLDASGLTLCEDVVSDLDLPLVTSAQVAGWGVRAANLVGASSRHPIDLVFLGEVSEGDRGGPSLVSGGTIRLAAGVPVPAGVDAVVPDADVTRVGDDVRFEGEAELNQNLQLQGSELADGEPLVSSGETLNSRSIALLAEVGFDKVLVRPRPRMVVLAANSTLVAPGEPLVSAEQRYDSGTALITAAAREDGATVYPVGVVDPVPSRLRQTIVDQAIRADLIVVLGGTDADNEAIAGVIGDLGHMDLAEVSVNRGTVYGFGRIGDEGVPIVLLPSGAVSAFVGYHAFLRPMLSRLNDADPMAPPRRYARLAGPVDSSLGNSGFVPAVLEDESVRPVSSAGAELAFDLHRANALLLVPEGAERLAAGERVQCLLLDEADARLPAPRAIRGA